MRQRSTGGASAAGLSAQAEHALLLRASFGCVRPALRAPPCTRGFRSRWDGNTASRDRARAARSPLRAIWDGRSPAAAMRSGRASGPALARCSRVLAEVEIVGDEVRPHRQRRKILGQKIGIIPGVHHRLEIRLERRSTRRVTGIELQQLDVLPRLGLHVDSSLAGWPAIIATTSIVLSVTSFASASSFDRKARLRVGESARRTSTDKASSS